MTGARPKLAARRMATAVQPAMASSADSPGTEHQPVLEPAGQLEGEALVGAGRARGTRRTAGRVPRSSDGRDGVQMDGTCSW